MVTATFRKLMLVAFPIYITATLDGGYIESIHALL